MTINVTKTGEKINKLRKENKISVAKLQDMLGVGMQAIYHWEQGRTLPSIDNLVELSRIFNVKIEDILFVE
mgnify:CR=1 FL=1